MQVTVSDTTLFHVAATWLGDAAQWNRIADLNHRSDPMIVGVATLLLPLMSGSVSTALPSEL
jgi:hypothetical protein